MPYWRLFYHLVWTTKRRAALLTAEVEPIIYGLMRAKAIGLGTTVFAMGGVEDHVHLVVSIPPKLAVAAFVGQVKRVASVRFNQEHPFAPRFVWQEEYGAFTFDGKRLPFVIDYVQRQREHHAFGTVIEALERLGDENGDQPVGVAVHEVHEAGMVYHLDDSAWRAEMDAL